MFSPMDSSPSERFNPHMIDSRTERKLKGHLLQPTLGIWNLPLKHTLEGDQSNPESIGSIKNL